MYGIINFFIYITEYCMLLIKCLNILLQYCDVGLFTCTHVSSEVSEPADGVSQMSVVVLSVVRRHDTCQKQQNVQFLGAITKLLRIPKTSSKDKAENNFNLRTAVWF